MTTTIDNSDTFDNLLEKYELYKFLRITAWIKRFLNNCQKTKCSGSLKTDETEHQKKFWIKREQQRVKNTEKFKISKEMLDLQENVEGIYVCRGQIEGSHPVFIPRDSLLAEKLIFQAHKNTLHGGVVLTMTKVRSMPFQVIRTDFAGPIYYCTKKKKKRVLFIQITPSSLKQEQCG